MPIYEYECRSCSLRFEVKRGFNESSLVNCPRCQCEARRVFSPVPIIFKGSGFYVTDTAEERKRLGNRRNGEGSLDVNKDEESSKPTTAEKKT